MKNTMKITIPYRGLEHYEKLLDESMTFAQEKQQEYKDKGETLHVELDLLVNSVREDVEGTDYI